MRMEFVAELLIKGYEHEWENVKDSAHQFLEEPRNFVASFKPPGFVKVTKHDPNEERILAGVLLLSQLPNALYVLWILLLQFFFIMVVR